MVRFSDKVHFGYSTQDKLKIIQKTGMRYCQDCIEEIHKPSEKDKKRYHCWTAVIPAYFLVPSPRLEIRCQDVWCRISKLLINYTLTLYGISIFLSTD